VASTYRAEYRAGPGPDWRKLTAAFPDIAAKLEELYVKRGERVRGYLYAARSCRFKTLSDAGEIAHRLGLTFAVCREGFPQLIDAGVSCDGTHLARGIA
jgi:hypothetical protein